LVGGGVAPNALWQGKMCGVVVGVCMGKTLKRKEDFLVGNEVFLGG